jgi:3-isopropylmalate dehydrogenase
MMRVAHVGVRSETDRRVLIGVLPGEGIGPEIVDAALAVLSAVERAADLRIELRRGGPIGAEAEATGGEALPAAAVEFCQRVFADGGALWAGAAGSRFVYDIRKQFDLFCKVSPIRVRDELAGASRFRPEHIRGVDILLVRENLSGLYQGRWSLEGASGNGRRAEHYYGAGERDVRRVLEVSARLAAERSGRLAIVIKRGGAPAISQLWRECADDVAEAYELAPSLLDVDYAAYRMLQEPRELDVVVAPNLFGDVLADLGGVLLGSRGLTYGGNFSFTSAAAYQTNHGSAYDLAGSDRANPAGQILSLAMLLRESFGLDAEAALIEDGLAAVWREGWRTFDLAAPGCTIVGTRELAERAAAHVAALAPVSG